MLSEEILLEDLDLFLKYIEDSETYLYVIVHRGKGKVGFIYDDDLYWIINCSEAPSLRTTRMPFC